MTQITPVQEPKEIQDEPYRYLNYFVNERTFQVYLLLSLLLLVILGYGIYLLNNLSPEFFWPGIILAVGAIIGVGYLFLEYCTKQIDAPNIKILKKLGNPQKICFAGLWVFLPRIHSFEDATQEIIDVEIDETFYTSDQLEAHVKASIAAQLAIRSPDDPKNPGDTQNNLRNLFRWLRARANLTKLIHQTGTAVLKQLINKYKMKALLIDQGKVRTDMRLAVELLMNETNDQDKEQLNTLGFTQNDLNKNTSLVELTGYRAVRVNIIDIDPPAAIRDAEQRKQTAIIRKKVETAEGDANINAATKAAVALEIKTTADSNREQKLLEAHAKGQREIEKVRTDALIARQDAKIDPWVQTGGEVAGAIITAIKKG